jgi:hypothetical protein
MNTAKEVREEKQGQLGRREVILRLLKEAGPQGRTNLELKDVCLRVGARIFELRERYEIETKPEKRGVYRFIFRGEKESQRRLFA